MKIKLLKVYLNFSDFLNNVYELKSAVVHNMEQQRVDGQYTCVHCVMYMTDACSTKKVKNSNNKKRWGPL